MARLGITNNTGKTDAQAAQGLMISSYLATDYSKLTTVLINYTTSAINLNIAHSNIPSNVQYTQYKPYLTNETNDLVPLNSIATGTTISIPARSIMTLVTLNSTPLGISNEPSSYEPTEVENELFTLGPNPFVQSTVFKMNSSKITKIALKIIDMKGVCLFASDNHYSNELIQLGKDLPIGMYTLLVSDLNTVTRIKMIKTE